MDFVARAKALLASKARIGLMILPLAAAVPAMATSLPTSNFSCALDGSPITNCTSSSTVQQLPTVGGIEGIKFFGPSSGSFVFDNSGFSGSAIHFLTTGTLGGGDLSNGTIIPFSYNFNLGTGGGFAQINSFTLSFNIFQFSGGFANGSATVFAGEGSLNGNQSGTGEIVVNGTLFDGFFTLVQSDLSLNLNLDGGFATLSIPSNSIDINPAAVTGVPEPASIALTGLGIALAGGFRLIRRRKGFVIVKDSKS